MLVAIEGIDGSGKRTQAEMLVARARRQGWSVAAFSFPQYGRNAFGRAVADYLNGRYGAVDEVAPQLAAPLFAGDRFAVREALQQARQERDLVVCDRYMASNLAHQAAKLPAAQRPAFVEWLQEIEIDLYGLPSADLSVFLDVPVETAGELVLDRGRREYTDAARDIHEADAGYLTECRAVYELLVETDDTTRWLFVRCDADGTLRSREEIADEVWRAIRRGRGSGEESRTP